MKTIIMLLLIFWCICLSAKQNTCLIIQTGLTDKGGHGNFDFDTGFAINALTNKHPLANFAYIKVNNNDELKEALKGYQNETLECLYIESHGIPDVITNEKTSFIGDVTSPYVVEDLFRPIIGKFSKNASIIFTACNLIDEGSKDDKFKRMKKVANNFGLKSGSIYMNSTKGYLITDKVIRQPFWTQETDRDKFGAFCFQLASPVVYPLYIARERLLTNKGYTLEVDNETYKFHRDDFFHVRGDYGD